MQHPRRCLIALAALALALLASATVATAGWRDGDLGFINMERVCRDGALVSIVAQSDGGSDTSGAVGARRHDNLAATIEPDKAFGGVGTPRPPSDYGPNIVADPALRTISITTQALAREADVSRGNGAPDIVQKYGVGILSWSSPQPPGTKVVLMYRRNDTLEAGIAEEIVADCTISAGNTATIANSALPGANSGIPSAQLGYQLFGWPAHGLLLRDSKPLAVGTRFSLADLAGHPLSYATSQARIGDLLPIDVAGTDLVSHIGNRSVNTFSANNPAISADGRFIAFESLASTLVANDTNDAHDIFVYDRQTSQTTRVSLSSAGAQANNSSTSAAISADGRYVAFQSSASNLVAGDTNSASDVFVRDRQTSQTTRVSVSSAGAQAQGASNNAAISADGRYVAFVSDAANLVSGDLGGHRDIFVHDMQTGQTTRVSVSSAGVEGNSDSDNPAISADGRFVAFESFASGLVAGDTNGASDIFVYDQQTSQTTRVSLSSAGVQANDGSFAAAISADGRYVAFQSSASNLVAGDTNNVDDIFVYDRQTSQTTRVSLSSAGDQATDASSTPAISGDGRYVVFLSQANNLVGYDAKGLQDVFLYDRQRATISCLSVCAQGMAADSFSSNAAISADGQFTAFEGYASNLLPSPTEKDGDIYVHYHASAEIAVGLPYQIYNPLARR